MFKEFKEFLMRGNVIDLAVGVVIGTAFTAIVTNVVNGLITPLVGLIVSLFTKGKDLNEAMSVLDWTPVKGVTFAFGDVVSALITFVITGFVLFLIVKAANKARDTAAKKEAVVPEVQIPTAEDYLADIRDLLVEQKKASTKDK
ncbi:large conductance mechanosensitive channel protein MscL [Enterococcus dongliensis]|uniref:Large-conductance mechanosensitive channel n=1 Tax=Enterococcus dongliensis TaxID=2559925 RepID=A0AAW8TJT0_9ENTE|nr:large conductance mechanosensitive channel protein MscL [Enterococcus dongliensis]MDT2597607.1 large conductance mechanosensitive channel protein MscL [Enterococcus dongliensis]MDT2603702.1 large conductance mechanosensitive channel protein MscL [Enterococcus dongliensis]MDT2612861.1 large conductance mechanosensitive channel protein MscL [Enterococcus dongliensis]MDT2634143.1 large conductance mechanosensitive channel protein MscL [Enterococcus dongliensis]MDT2637073.1 large conductance me